MATEDTPVVLQTLESAFVDAIDAEERAEPKSKQYSTYHVVNGHVA